MYLKEYDMLKQSYAEDHGILVGGILRSNVVLTTEDLLGFAFGVDVASPIGTNWASRSPMVCRDGGVYSVGALDAQVSCSIHGKYAYTPDDLKKGKRVPWFMVQQWGESTAPQQ